MNLGGGVQIFCGGCGEEDLRWLSIGWILAGELLLVVVCCGFGYL